MCFSGRADPSVSSSPHGTSDDGVDRGVSGPAFRIEIGGRGRLSQRVRHNEL